MKTGTDPRLTAFVRTFAGPVIARYAVRLIRVVALTPQGRAVGLFLLLLLAGFLLIPATLAGLLVHIATQDSQQAWLAFSILLVLGVATLMFFAISILQRWRRFKAQYRR